MNPSKHEPLARCPECGGPRVDGMTCQEQLAVVLGWESEDPELSNLHFYTVASFNLQHPAQFTDEALTELRTPSSRLTTGPLPSLTSDEEWAPASRAASASSRSQTPVTPYSENGRSRSQTSSALGDLRALPTA